MSKPLINTGAVTVQVRNFNFKVSVETDPDYDVTRSSTMDRPRNGGGTIGSMSKRPGGFAAIWREHH